MNTSSANPASGSYVMARAHMTSTNTKMAKEDARSWSCSDVGLWLKRNGFKDYVETLSKQHKIDGAALLALTENDLRCPPLQMQTLGDIKRLWLAVSELQKKFFTPNLSVSNGSIDRRSLDRVDGLRHYAESGSDEDSDDENSGITGHLSRVSDFSRTVLSIVYASMVFFLTSFVMAFVHDRVPDMKKYPPLPDIVLDNVPLIPWAFTMCEISAMILTAILATVVFLHKHRLILIRRIFALAGTVFLLRCLTMFVTSLSVPGIHLECSGKLYGDTSTRLQRAGEIFFGVGLSLNGVRSCGDYMFSGHTVSITLLNFFITEYTPSSMYYLHTSCWVLNLFGIFFILAAHEHYSIDVVIAFYISSRLFLYYHTLANAKALRRGDRKRFRVWFPLFWFFEKKMEGKVPNEYEWPLPWPKFLCHKGKKV